MSDPFLVVIASIGSGFVVGIMIGYFLKKVIKIIIFAAGGIVALLLYFQQVNMISINIEKMEGSFISLLNSVISTFGKTAPIADTNSLAVPLVGGLSAIPLVGGLSAGFAIGLMKG